MTSSDNAHNNLKNYLQRSLLKFPSVSRFMAAILNIIPQ